jgi:parvulin-like peptidyl-prolyl isomerase
MRALRIAVLPAALVVVLALLAAACGGGGGGGSVPSGAVAVVKGTPIKKTQLDNLMRQAQHSYASQKRTFPKTGSPEFITLQGQAVAFLVQREEFSQKAKELGVDVAPKQIDARLKQIKKQFFSGSEKKYQAQLKQQGLSEADVRDSIETQLISEGLFQKVTKDVKVSDKDVKAYYDQHPEQYSQPATRDVRHILVKNKALADKLYAQIKGGANFAALAKKYSQDPGSKAQGGKLTVYKGQTVPQFDKVAFSLKTNELSPPVHTQFGWHIIQALSSVKSKKTTPFAQVTESIRQQLLQQKRSTAMTDWVNSVKKEYEHSVSYAKGFSPPPTTAASTASGTSTTG